MKKLRITLVAVLAVLFCQSQEEISIEDYRFTMSVARTGLMHIKLAQLASANASSEETKNFGERMVIHYSQTNKEIKRLADQRGLFIPGDLNKKQQKRFNKISSKKGVDFDKAYAKFLKKEHKNDANVFDKEIKNGQDIELKNWAFLTLEKMELRIQGVDKSNDELVMEKLEKLITYK